MADHKTRKDYARMALLAVFSKAQLESLVDEQKRPWLWDRRVICQYLLHQWDDAFTSEIIEAVRQKVT